jgi:hypothetical protein
MSQLNWVKMTQSWTLLWVDTLRVSSRHQKAYKSSQLLIQGVTNHLLSPLQQQRTLLVLGVPQDWQNHKVSSGDWVVSLVDYLCLHNLTVQLHLPHLLLNLEGLSGRQALLQN